MLIFLISAFDSCTDNQSKSSGDIEDIWVCSDETSFKSLAGVEKPGIKFYRDQNGKWEARGFFLWNDDYHRSWKIRDVQYDENSGNLDLTDVDGNTFKGVLKKKSRRIEGTINVKYKDSIASDSVVLVPAGENLEIQLFHPRIPDNCEDSECLYHVPQVHNDGLETASIYDGNVDSKSLVNLISKIIDQDYGRVESLLIVKDNKLIVEEYFYGYNRNNLHKIYSCTKGITSLLLGMALDRHPKISVDQPIFSFFPKYDSLKTKEKGSITLKDVLTMSAGLEWHEYPEEMYESEDRIHYVLSRPLETTPGKHFHYNSGLSVVIGGVIASLEGEDVQGFADKNFFQALGIKNYSWRTNIYNDLEYWNGLEMTPRDMAKIGLLVLNDGKWKGKQIVSKNWIEASTSPHMVADRYFEYGYQWWLRTKNSKCWWNDNPDMNPALEHDMVVAIGWGSQFIMVVRDLKLVVVMTGSNFRNEEKEYSAFPMVIDEIIPALTGQGQMNTPALY